MPLLAAAPIVPTTLCCSPWRPADGSCPEAASCSMDNTVCAARAAILAAMGFSHEAKSWFTMAVGVGAGMGTGAGMGAGAGATKAAWNDDGLAAAAGAGASCGMACGGSIVARTGDGAGPEAADAVAAEASSYPDGAGSVDLACTEPWFSLPSTPRPSNAATVVSAAVARLLAPSWLNGWLGCCCACCARCCGCGGWA